MPALRARPPTSYFLLSTFYFLSHFLYSLGKHATRLALTINHFNNRPPKRLACFE
ncbi:MAG: hypothetical protein H0X40_06560 [Chthoniobacterales bacterium]|nr:hypothetical protein [Chthoniobacterales bacterium]